EKNRCKTGRFSPILSGGVLVPSPPEPGPHFLLRAIQPARIAKRLPLGRLGGGLGGGSSRPSLEWERFGYHPADGCLETERPLHFRRHGGDGGHRAPAAGDAGHARVDRKSVV